MALTVKLVNKNGTLAVMDDEFGKVGTGKAKPSKSFPGFITLTLRIKNRKADLKKKILVDDFLVIRVPIDWTSI
ncbi:MAG TPA: hypothetical protein VEP90_24080 [Methylomirabilota bacterium]|nr:hypothetical protein [Methylomirabilota bacterium]